MSILERPTRQSKPNRRFPRQFAAARNADGSIEINGISYSVERIPAGECGSIAFRLSKHDCDGLCYDVIRTHFGIVECDCPSYEATHRGLGLGTCKHGRALVELGMVPAPGGSEPAAPTAAAPDESFLAELDPDWSLLPRTDGQGLTPEEFARVARQGAKARAQYRCDVPDAPAADLERVELKARQDALRAVLRARTAPPLPGVATVGEVLEVVATETAALDFRTIPGADMSQEELADLAELNAANPAGMVEADLDHWPAFDQWPANASDWYWVARPDPLLTLPELIEHEAARMRRMETGAGDLMARALESLARDVRTVSADRPDQLDERLSILDRDYADHAAAWEPELTPAGRWA